MILWRFSLLVVLFAALLPLVSGCGPSRPAVVEAHGVVLLNKEPLPGAVVEFVPMAEGFDSEMKSLAVTDDQGKFTLKCNWQEQPGAAVAKHKVLVYENAPSGSEEARVRGSRNRAPAQTPSLPNRPIPTKYGTVASTPVEIEVKQGQADYTVDLVRQ